MYHAWGSMRWQTGSATNLFGYDGQQQDFSSGLFFLRARYYDPLSGRFTQQDPVQDGGNWYVYAGNSPVNATDPCGLCDKTSGYYHFTKAEASKLADWYYARARFWRGVRNGAGLGSAGAGAVRAGLAALKVLAGSNPYGWGLVILLASVAFAANQLEGWSLDTMYVLGHAPSGGVTVDWFWGAVMSHIETGTTTGSSVASDTKGEPLPWAIKDEKISCRSIDWRTFEGKYFVADFGGLGSKNKAPL